MTRYCVENIYEFDKRRDGMGKDYSSTPLKVTPKFKYIPVQLNLVLFIINFDVSKVIVFYINRISKIL